MARAHRETPNGSACGRASSFELRPPWVGAGKELCVDLEVERADLARAAASLLMDLIRFPQRGDDPTA